jgi:hypothetical protein
MDALGDEELCRLTRLDDGIALAQFIEGTGCGVFANGRELPPWASVKAQELIDAALGNAPVVTTQSDPKYFVLSWNSNNDWLGLLRGPFGAGELRAKIRKGPRMAP